MLKLFVHIACIYLISLLIMLGGCDNKRPPGTENMIYIPPGEFTIGSDDTDINALAKEYGSKHSVYFKNESPLRIINLEGFYIDKFETTNREYMLFIATTDHKAPDHWKNGMYPPGKEEHPVVSVTWSEAQEYCNWNNGKNLPTEEEWEKASRGPYGNVYPWGNQFEEGRGNLSKGDTIPVGNMKDDKSYYGVYDMGGNVMEWTYSWYKPYPGSNFNSKEFGEKNRVIKGGYGTGSGHYRMGNYFSRGSFRNFFKPDGKGLDLGFRCVQPHNQKNK